MSERLWNILADSFPKLLRYGIEVTIPLTVLSFSLALVIAVIVALIQYANVKVLRQICRFYIWIIRGTPLLVQLYLVFYGLPSVGIVIDAFPAAVLVLGFNEGAYMAETMRGALESVSRGQMEAGYCVGMNYVQIMAHVVLPQAFRTAFPALGNSMIAMLKETSMAATITVMEMFRQAGPVRRSGADLPAVLHRTVLGSAAGRKAPGDVWREQAMMLDIKHVHKRFDKLEVLKGIDLTVNKGDVVAILGPSGSGKTTFLRCLNFLERADQGEMVFDGERFDLHAASHADIARIRKKTAFVFQNYNLFLNKTVLQNVTLGLTVAGKMKKDQANEIALAALKRVGMADKLSSYPSQLSGGQQQRVAIARGLASNPEIIYFDEPTSALDPELIGEVLAVMRQLAEEGMTMLVVTHEMDFARHVSSKVLFMADGSVVESGPSREFFEHPRQERSREFIKSILEARK